MSDDCCLHFCGEGHTLEEFERLMTELVERTDTQYSHLNTICAIDSNGQMAGACVSYDGAELLRLRQPFIDAVKKYFSHDLNSMEEETAAGELYVDSLAVFPEYRRQGVATALLQATVGKARQLGDDPVGLLVDESNPRAERLYRSIGFEQVGTSTWGGHPMKHMRKKPD